MSPHNHGQLSQKSCCHAVLQIEDEDEVGPRNNGQGEAGTKSKDKGKNKARLISSPSNSEAAPGGSEDEAAQKQKKPITSNQARKSCNRSLTKSKQTRTSKRTTRRASPPLPMLPSTKTLGNNCQKMMMLKASAAPSLNGWPLSTPVWKTGLINHSHRYEEPRRDTTKSTLTTGLSELH